jgi:hypothetical protein
MSIHGHSICVGDFGVKFHCFREYFPVYDLSGKPNCTPKGGYT